ncbi:glycosyltransferase family 4 protein [Candidatus Bathyarchaeota archaeon]|jgi:glycosyltransferase involved in cell wall biosynthesis|nr:glycosyltransferase family 4 protein [Candidatus Bathyarchaeota archaeon]
MKTVILRAPLLSLSGYGVHSRQVFRWLLEQDVALITQVVSWGNTSWMVNPDMENGLIGKIMSHSRSPEEVNIQPDVSIQVQLPNEWDPALAKVNIGFSAWVETDVCNPAWIQAANRMSAIVVPSEFTRSVIEKTGKVTVPLYVVPEAFISEVLEPELPELPIEVETDFNFLMVGQITGNSPDNDRKNTFFALKWMCEQFKDDPNVGIVVKTNSARSTAIDKHTTRRSLSSAIQQVRKGPYPRIYMLHGEMKAEEMASLYRHPSIKALVTFTRGEGWGLPILEAAASDLPIIATNWSGHLDFLSKGRFIPIDYTLSEIPESRVDNTIFVKGAKWAQPNEADAKKKLQKFRDKPAIPQKWATDTGPVIREAFSQEAINQHYNEALGRYV